MRKISILTLLMTLAMVLTSCSPDTMQRSRERKVERQIARYSHVLEKKGRDPGLLRNRAYYYGQLGKWELAVQDLGEAMMLNPDDSTLLYNLGVASLQNGDTLSAQAAATECVELYPAMTRAWVLRGQIFLLEGNQPLALQSFESALELDPHSIPAQAGRGVALFNQGQLDQAAPIFSYLTTADSTSGIFWLYRGMLAGRGYDNLPPEVALQRALTYSPASSYAKTHLALRKFQQDSISIALGLLREVAASDSLLTIMDIE